MYITWLHLFLFFTCVWANNNKKLSSLSPECIGENDKIKITNYPTELVVEKRPEKIQARAGFEPMTSAIPVQRSTN